MGLVPKCPQKVKGYASIQALGILYLRSESEGLYGRHQSRELFGKDVSTIVITLDTFNDFQKLLGDTG